MTAETQAAFSSAHAAWALVIITIPAVIGGLIAAFRASEAFRLESQPVLVVTAPPQTDRSGFGDAGILPTSYIVTGSPSIAQGLRLKEWTFSDEPPEPSSSQPGEVAFVDHRSLKPSIVLEIQNVGRSPAALIEIDLEISVRSIILNDGRLHEL